jgi:methylthioribulose-1-phosphate dehydratase
MTDADQAAAAELIALGRLFAGRGWVPATAGNFSCRVGGTRIAITMSGVDKGALAASDIAFLDLGGPMAPGVSAETPLHLQLYRRDSAIGSVLHTHSLAATVVGRAHAGANAIVLEGYEVQKGLRGRTRHDRPLALPLIANSQDMDALAEEVSRRLDVCEETFGYVLAGHGLYAWGRDAAEARRHLEALEFLLVCELERGRYRP